MYRNKYDYRIPILHFVLFLRCCPSGGNRKTANDKANLIFINNVMLIIKLPTSRKVGEGLHN